MISSSFISVPMPTEHRSACDSVEAPREARLWIDRVGAWQLWFPERLTIGGPQSVDARRPGADLALFADLSRRHAEIARDGEHYLLTLHGAGAINGRRCEGEQLLRSGDEIGLGEDVRLRFEIPSPLSGSARITFPSGHRPSERLDGLVLLAETCLIGPQASHHIVCPAATSTLILYPKEARLWCRSQEVWRLDERSIDGAAGISHGAVVGTDSHTFRVELR